MPRTPLAILLTGAALFWSASRSHGAIVWADDGEQGGSRVIDRTGPGYSLVQSEIAGQGEWAFHLANPGLQDNWFEIAQPLVIEQDTQLYFLSRLGWSSAAQVARVQGSLDGNDWESLNLYSQAGSDSAGESAFSLRTIDLSPFAGQLLRLRFYYDYIEGAGGGYPQSVPGVGWYVDDIQIASQLQKRQYAIGNPSADEQLYLEYINRARADAMAEAERLIHASDPLITSSYSFFNIDLDDVVAQFGRYVAAGLISQVAQPLAFNAKLLGAAQLHSQDMFANQFQGHVSSSQPPAPLQPVGALAARLAALGYQTLAAAENVYAYASTVAQGHAAFNVDWGDNSNPADPAFDVAFLGQGMQNPASHRLNIHNPNFKEIGIGVVNGTNGPVGPQIVTQDFSAPGNATFITGVVYVDSNANDFYDVGEGRSGVRIDVDGSAFFAVSSDSGGYAVPVSGDGAYKVAFSGGGLPGFEKTVVVSGGANVKIDLRAALSNRSGADLTADHIVDGADLAVLLADFGVGPRGDADQDGDSDGADFLIWQREIGVASLIAANSGATAPEPSAALLAACGLAMLAARRQREHSKNCLWMGSDITCRRSHVVGGVRASSQRPR